MVIGEKYRITMLTEGLIRLEDSEDGIFEDRATDGVFQRFSRDKLQTSHMEDRIEIHTSRIHLIYNEKRIFESWTEYSVKGI